MKHIMVFDISNTQDDYSNVMEGISLIINNQFEKFADLKKAHLDNKFYRTILPENGQVARYFECPRKDIIHDNALFNENFSNKSLEETYFDTYNSSNEQTILENLKKLQFFLQDKNRIKASIPIAMVAKYTDSKNIKKRDFTNSNQNNDIYYHIRVNVKNDKLYNLQYLALLLKKYRNLVSSKRLTVILLGDNASLNYYPFCDPKSIESINRLNEDHRLFSRYLRLLAQDNTGIIYAPYFESIDNENHYFATVLPMDFKNASVGNNFFPIIEVGADEYNKIFINSENIDDDLTSEITVNSLYNKNSNKNNKFSLFQTGRYRYFNADSPKPHEALLAYIAETAWKKLQQNWYTNGKFDEKKFSNDRNTIIHRFTEVKNNWITFAIFSFILNSSSSKNNMTTRINDSYKMAREISSAMQQLIQNSIQHSEKKSCFFSFYLNNNKLNIMVSDLNTKNTIIENFKQRLNEEIITIEESKENYSLFENLIFGHKNLSNSNSISLRHFFNVFYNKKPNKDCEGYEKLCKEYDKDQEMIKLWSDFRGSDSTAHIGLLLFYQTICRCHADLMLQSSKVYHSDDMVNNIFIDDEITRNDGPRRYSKGAIENKHIIPGTQYHIIIPVDKWYTNAPQGEGSISDVQKFSEGYSSFAKYVDYQAINAPYKDELFNKLLLANNSNFVQANKKFQLQLLWTSYWSNFYEKISKSEKIIYVWRAPDRLNDYFSSLDNCEIFIKGMFAALNCIKKDETPIYFAFSNLNSVFLESLRDICVSLSNKPFRENVQLFFVDQEYKYHTQLFGSSFNEAVYNATQLCIEHGSSLFRYFDTTNSNKIRINSSKKTTTPIDVLPFDTIVTKNDKSTTTIFEQRISSIIEERLNKENTNGYKLSDTHTRLGNKVHIQSFYEMSFLFYRTTISNRVAFSILRLYSNNIKSKINKSELELKPMLYYSYASYSKAILTSIVEMTRSYIELYFQEFVNADKTLREQFRNNNEALKKIISEAKEQVAFASYQHNLQSESKSDSVQLYFGIPEKFCGGKLNISEKGLGMIIDLNNDIDVIQIVPISSSMSTFDKMFQKIRKHAISNSNKHSLNLSANYTTLWVCDGTKYSERKINGHLFPSDIEKSYWTITNLKKREICINDAALTELRNCPHIYYFLQKTSIWEHPLSCSLCFPKDTELIREVPLVETDLTSTVPSQQIREERAENMIKEYTQDEIDTNNQRLIWLKDCVHYGHIRRSKNHYQYYISSQDYFYKSEVQNDIKNWLNGLREKESSSPKLKIIFSPEHNTNVGFAQYVNTYYFGGTAEIVSINEDRVFRSNFICEHKMLRQLIERLHIQNDVFDNEPVEFYFVDDSINTGLTVHKANSLLRSLLPNEYVDKYPTYLFKKCFILIDRISKASKLSYVCSGKPSDFHAYVHIDISHMRVQGDSCVGCKLKNEAMNLFKRSASKLTANYWANKYNNLLAIEYDDVNNMKSLKEDKLAYERLVLSHIAQNYIFNDGINTRQIGEYYDCILYLFETILNYNEKSRQKKGNNRYKYTDLISNLFVGYKVTARKLEISELLLKLLSRPFFSFDYSFKVQIQSLILIIAECYLRTYSNDSKIIIDKYNGSSHNDWKSNVEILKNMIPADDKYKQFLRDNNRLERTIDIIKSFMKLHNNNPVVISKFLKDTIFEAIADLRSTYLLRKSVIIKVDKFVKINLSDQNLPCCESKCIYLHDSKQCIRRQDYCFWISYFAHVQRIIDCSNDEIKAVWFKYLVLTGEELGNNKVNNPLSFEHGNDLGISKFLSNKSIPIASELLLTTATTEFDIVEKNCNNKTDTRHFLSNYELTRKWMSQKDEFNKATEKWFNLLPSENNKPNKTINDINDRYKDFLEEMIGYIYALTGIKEDIFNIALLTMSNEVSVASIDNIQLVNEHFGKQTLENNDIKQSRYIIKDRVVSAYNCNECPDQAVGVLKNNGYQIVFSEPTVDCEDYKEQQKTIFYDSNHHVSGNHRKPYIIIEFDNPVKEDYSYVQNNELGRKLVKLSHVFLYISMAPENLSDRNFLPWTILHTVLSYRNRILRFLSEDFNGNIMEKHSVSMQEEAILTHERSASHASTADEKGVLRVFGLENVSELKNINYPIELEGRTIETNTSVNYYHSSVLWLLLQNYVNNQIARLFSRHFNVHDSNLIVNDGIPALYISKMDEQKDDAFKHCLEEFKDININTVYNQTDFEDNRFELLNKVSNIKCYVVPSEKCYYSDCSEKRFYNTEYIRCIILDIMLTSLKYATVDKDLLPRIDNLLTYREKDEGRVKSHIFLFKDGNQLVIINNVKSNRISKEKIDFYNEEIYRRTHDALDYGDGHMSLFTIRSFILGIENNDHQTILKQDTEFKYINKEFILERYKHRTFCKENLNIIEKYNIWFETRLPIFKEDN